MEGAPRPPETASANVDSGSEWRNVLGLLLFARSVDATARTQWGDHADAKLADARARSLATFGHLLLTIRRFFHGRRRPGPPGRNEPCPCGSGMKYKKCCLN